MTSYLIEDDAKNLQNGVVHLAQIADFRMGYLKTHFFHLSLTFFPPEFPFKPGS